MGVTAEDFTVAGAAPAYNAADSQQTMPTAAGRLPLRATKLDERGKKLVSLSADFQSTVAAHNAKYNVSGDAFMEAQPPKAGGAPPPQATETTEWPAGRAVENPAEVVADGEALLELPTSQPDLANVLIDCKAIKSKAKRNTKPGTKQDTTPDTKPDANVQPWGEPIVREEPDPDLMLDPLIQELFRSMPEPIPEPAPDAIVATPVAEPISESIPKPLPFANIRHLLLPDVKQMLDLILPYSA